MNLPNQCVELLRLPDGRYLVVETVPSSDDGSNGVVTRVQQLAPLYRLRPLDDVDAALLNSFWHESNQVRK